MPCDIGYKSTARVVVPLIEPLTFKQRISAPAVDAELMGLIGQDDPDFVDWMMDLDIDAPLEAALKNALSASGNTSPVTFAIETGDLSATARYRTRTEKSQVEQIAARVSVRWQAEILSIVAQLLDFETTVTTSMADGTEIVTLEGEKQGAEQVHEYLRVTLDTRRESNIRFEHFSSKANLASVRSKFVALAQKLGVKIVLSEQQESGSPIQSGTLHKHFLKGGKS